MIDGSEKRSRELAWNFRIRMFVKSAVTSFVGCHLCIFIFMIP